MSRSRAQSGRCLALILAALGAVSCKGPDPNEQKETAAPSHEGELFRVGSLVVYETDLERRLQERYAGRTDDQTRQAAIDDLVQRARFTQAALDAGLADDPMIRDEVSRILTSRHRDSELTPKLTAQLQIPEERLRALYQANLAQFQAPEKRHVAVLWLDSGVDPDRATRYVEKMSKAREFALQNRDILDHPEKGFSVLGADYSEHSASRFRGGLVGWMESAGGLDAWTKAVAEIAFTLEKKGDISEVTTHKEGIFLVRVVDLKPAVTRPFESVTAELERAERARVRKEIEAKFEQEIADKYPVEWGK